MGIIDNETTVAMLGVYSTLCGGPAVTSPIPSKGYAPSAYVAGLWALRLQRQREREPVAVVGSPAWTSFMPMRIAIVWVVFTRLGVCT